MKINLLSDYRGQLTAEVFYPAGVLEVGTDIPEEHALALVQGGRALEVEAVKAADKPAPPSPAPVKPTAPVAKKPGRKGEL